MCRARRGGPRTPSTSADANLDCVFVENSLFSPIVDDEEAGSFLDLFPQRSPTQSWRNLEFFEKILEFIAKILEFL